jgi:hypothetical protein
MTFSMNAANFIDLIAGFLLPVLSPANQTGTA